MQLLAEILSLTADNMFFFISQTNANIYKSKNYLFQGRSVQILLAMTHILKGKIRKICHI